MATQQQVTYVLDYETREIRSHPGGDNQWISKYYFQIDIRGNVKVQEVGRYSHDRGASFGNKRMILSIDDNIPIPTYLVDVLKEVISCDVINDTGFWHRNVINVFNKIKSGLKELANNPLDATDIKSQLGFSMNKNDILQNELKEMEQKCKNIQAAYVDTLKDNEKLKKEIEDLKAKNTNITNIAKEFIKRDGERLTEETSKLIMEMKMNRLKRDRACSTNEFGLEFGPEFEPEFSDIFKTD